MAKDFPAKSKADKELLIISFHQRYRASFLQATKILDYLEMPKSNGWERTLEYLFQLSDSKKSQAYWDDLFNFYMDSLVYGEKVIKIYSLETDAFNKALAHISQKKRSKNLLGKPFPFYPDYYDSPTKIQLIDSIQDEDGTFHFIYAGIFSQYERIKIPSTMLTEEAKDELDDISEIYGLERSLYPLYNSIVFDVEREQIELRVDASCHLSINGHRRVMQKLEDTLRTILLDSCGEETATIRPVNLFPCIRKLYDSKEGKVKSMSFTATTGIRDDLVMVNDKDLRRETYHKAGKNALADDIDIYKIGVQFLSGGEDFVTRPECHLESSLREQKRRYRELFEFSISKSLTREDFEIARNTVIGMTE